MIMCRLLGITGRFTLAAFLLAMFACSKGTAGATAPDRFEPVETFSADSAYNYVARQVEFGPRVPGSAPHSACVDWIVGSLTDFGADSVAILGDEVKAWDGSVLPVKNILARFKGLSDSVAPVLLVAHYDTRPWADRDEDAAARSASFDGANDGASGVAVLLEIARNLGKAPSDVPVYLLFTDVEDYGAPEDVAADDDTWCLGSQQFASRLPFQKTDMPRFGILLDMVGGCDAKFPREYFSVMLAPAPTAKVWSMAHKLGLANRFPSRIGGAINDDHIPLCHAGIPTADIIESANPSTGSFPPTWHTRNDNLENISRTTLGDVGRTVINVIYNEK